MIFYLDAHINEIASLDKDDVVYLIAELMNSHIRGHHFILVDRDVCDWVLANCNLYERHSAMLKKIKEKHAQFHGMLSSSKIHVRIKIEPHEIEFHSAYGRSYYSIGFAELINGNYLQQSTFVVENSESDGRLYEKIFEIIAASDSLNIFSYYFDLESGGGSSIYKAFETQILRKKVVVCIVDRDQDCPQSRMGENMKKCQRVLMAHDKKFFGSLFFTHGRYVENYIPLIVFNEMEHYQTLSILNFAAANDIVDHSLFWLYLDLRNGFQGDAIDNCEHQKAWYSLLMPNCKDFSVICYDGFGEAKNNCIKNLFIHQNKNALSIFSEYINSSEWDNFRVQFENILWHFVAPTKSRLHG